MSLVLKQYGIELHRVEYDDIELIRYWRNHPDIRKYMGYKKKISQNQQKEWFEKINNKLNYYFVIHYQNEKIGVINCKDVNLEDRYGEGGIFIWDNEALNSFAPSLATILLMDVIFNRLEITDVSFIQILKTNQRAISYNKKLGYFLAPHQEKVHNQLYMLTKGRFNHVLPKLQKGASIATGTSGEFIITGEESDLNLEQINDLLRSYR